MVCTCLTSVQRLSETNYERWCPLIVRYDVIIFSLVGMPGFLIRELSLTVYKVEYNLTSVLHSSAQVMLIVLAEASSSACSGSVTTPAHTWFDGMNVPDKVETISLQIKRCAIPGKRLDVKSTYHQRILFQAP